MSSPSILERARRALWLAGGLALAAGQAWAVPGVADFDGGTWQGVQQGMRRPTAFVFSSTDCVHCPKVIQALSDAAARSHGRAGLAVVVMDGQGQEAEVRRHALYRRADALYVFNGQEMALRHSVNPQWRGLTPYVAFVTPGEAARFFTGLPPADEVRRFFK